MYTINKMLEGTQVVSGMQIKDYKASLILGFIRWQPLLLFLLLLLLWGSSHLWLHHIDETAAGVDQSIWLLIILSLSTFLLLSALCWWLLQRFWLSAGLPPLKIMVSQFDTLSLWQQLGFYLASFSLLLVAASVCLNAIC